MTKLHVVVVAYDMARELPRTLDTLDVGYQRGVDASDYSVTVIDNGSPTPVPTSAVEQRQAPFHLVRIDDARPVPGPAINEAIGAVESDAVLIFIDGARMASPGLVTTTLDALRLDERAVVATVGWHLGEVPHMRAPEVGYDQEAEDALLDTVDWRDDGYQLFTIATLAGSSSRGWFGPLGESNALAMARPLWQELGGFEERFALPGGGLSNHDLYRRACGASGTRLVELLGEGTFHQYHGGAATSRRFGWEEMAAEYEAIRGQAFQPPATKPTLLGQVPTPALSHIATSATFAQERRARWGW